MTTVEPSHNSRHLCLVTGASSGIGEALAREYAARGWDLILTARRETQMQAIADELAEKYGTVSHIFALDLSTPDAPKMLLAMIKAKGLQVDGLINNAGYGLPGTYLETSWEQQQANIYLMLNNPCALAHALTEGMKTRGFGEIINVSSLAGHISGSKGHTTYAAIKSFMIKFSQSLKAELSPYGVKVSALCPGFTYSEFHDVNNTRDAINRLPKFMFKTSEYVAKSGIAALERGKTVHIPGTFNKGLAVLARLLPEALAEKIIASNSERIRKSSLHD